MTRYDVAIIGSGIAGASLASELAERCSVLLLETESQPGYHSTGRSAAFWSETYGGPDIQPLTSASGPFLANPPSEFSERSFLSARGALHIAQTGGEALVEAMFAEFLASGVSLDRVDRNGINQRLRGSHIDWTCGLWEPDCCDIDVAGLHGAYLAHARKNDVALRCNAAVRGLHYRGGHWSIETTGGTYEAGLVVNAAGAWADEIAGLAGLRTLGLQPYRRTVVQLAVDPPAPADLPLVVGLDGSFYFKPEAGGRLWLSPHDETPSPACDAAPEEWDVALAIDRFQQVVDWKIVKLETRWAGLRTFAADRLPVIGRDPLLPDFFWLAGQGGFGIQTAPAVAQLAAGLILGGPLADTIIDPKRYAPNRFR